MNNPAVDRYFQDISKKFEISADNVRRIAFGEDTGLKHSIISSVLIEFVRHSTTSDGLIFAMVWQGEHVDNVVTNLQDYDWTAQVMEGLNLRLHRTSYRTQVIFANSIFADYAYFEYLLEKRPGAAFIILQPDDISEIQAVCNQKNLPLVLLAPPAKVDLSLHYTIRVDDKSAMKNIVDYIFNLGHRRIAFITGNQRHHAGVERLAGYYEGLKNVGLSLNEDWIFEGNWREDTGYSAAQHFLNTALQPGDYREAVKILSRKQIFISDFDQMLGRMIRVQCYYELRDPDLLEHLLESCRKHYSRLKSIGESYRRLMQQFIRLTRRLYQAWNQPEQAQIARKVLRKLKEEDRPASPEWLEAKARELL